MKDKGSAATGVFYVWIICLIASFLPQGLYPQTGSFSGDWLTSLGALEMKVSGSSVSGTYISGSLTGVIEGKISRDGRLLSGAWTLDKESGRFIFRLNGEDNAFNGRWWKGKTQSGSDWIGIRKNALATGISVQNFRGHWVSNYGRMNLNVTGQTISGEFYGKRNRGSITGNMDPRTGKLIGTWQDTDHKGRIILNFVEGGNGFLGEWWFEDNTYGGYWYAVRNTPLEECISGNCETGGGTYVWANGSRYEGDWKDSKYHGAGRQYDFKGNLKYKGIWVEGVYQGDCTSGDCQNGSGALTFINGDQYEGSFADGLPEGNGRYLYRNGDIYEGEFKAGFPHGSGSYTWAASGDKYTGRFSRGIIQGEGAYHFAGGDVYEGNFRRGQRHGQGTMVWAGGDRYEGNWENDAMSGKGVYSYKDGDSYKGEFKNGLKDGDGAYTFANGNSILAHWKDDKVDKFDSASSGYSGLAEQTGAPALPLTIENKKPGALAAAGETAEENVFLIYKIEEVAPYSSTAAEEQKEVHISYYIVHGSGNMDEASAKTLLKDRSGMEISAQFRVEKVPNPNTRIKQILGRYRYDIVPTRVHTSFEGYFYSEL